MKNISNHIRKILTLTIVCCLLVTTISSVSVFAEDISMHWAATDINYLMEKGIVRGDDMGNINPNNNITRAESVAIINRAFEFTQMDNSNFPDVRSGAWYYNDFAIAKKNGYIIGDNSGSANPDKPITRAEVAVIFARVLALRPASYTSTFADNAMFPDWSTDSIIAMTDKGLIQGYPDNTFKANNNITRAEAFTILARILRANGKKNGDNKTPSAPTDDGNNTGGIGIPGGNGSSGGNGGLGGGGTTTANIISTVPLTGSADHNSTYTLPATVIANLDGGGTKDFAVTWTPSVVDTSVCGTFVFEGALTMTSGYANPSNVKAKLTLTINPVITGITIIQKPAKCLYNLGEGLLIDGLIVTGEYSDDSTVVLPVSVANITGYDSNTPGEQELTVTAFNYSATFAVEVFDLVENGALVGILQPESQTLANGVAKTVSGLNLPPFVVIQVDDGDDAIRALAVVEWDVAAAPYDPEMKSAQSFYVNGTVTLPDGVDNPESVSLDIQIFISVSIAIHTVTFDLNGQTGAAIRSQAVEHGGSAEAPSQPTSVSHDFIGWYRDANGTGDAWNFASDAVLDDVHLYAKWAIKTYTISFSKGNADGDPTLPENLVVNHGTAAVKPTDPALAGYAFVGWYTDAALEIPYVWSTPVTSSFALYAKFADVLTAARDALTFDRIKGANTSQQGILTNLALLASLPDHPGITITWVSNDTTVISNTGVVTRPASSEADVEVMLTATLTLGGRSLTKNFDLIVRKQGIIDVVITGGDTRYAPGYPIASVDSEGRVTLKIKLEPNVATAVKPIIAYFAMDVWYAEWANFDRESILFGHMVINENAAYTVQASGPIGEMVIDGDGESTFTSHYSVMAGTNPVAVGIVLLDNDNLDDPLSSATVIHLTAEETGYVDSSGPYGVGVVFNAAGDKIYAYFDRPVSNTNANLPPVTDFELTGTTATVTDVKIGNDPTTFEDRQSWLVLTLSSPVSEATQGSGVQLKYTADSGANVITDTHSNAATSGIEWWDITPGKQNISAYVNPSEGTLVINFVPGIRMLSNYDSIIDSGIFSLSYNNTPVGNLKFVEFGVAITAGDVFFSFNKITSGTPTTGDFKVTITSGFTNYAFDPITVSAQVVNGVMPPISTSGVSAEQSGYGGIIVTLPAGTILSGYSHYGCSYSLMADGKRVLVRQANYGDQNQVYLELSDRQSDILSSAASVTLTYNPNAGGHIRDLYSSLSDITGALVPAFGPVAVTK